MSDASSNDDDWREPDDVWDFDFGDDDDGGALVPRKPKPGSGAPAMALAASVG